MKQIKQALVRLIVSIINAMSKDIEEEKDVYKFESYDFVINNLSDKIIASEIRNIEAGFDLEFSDEIYTIFTDNEGLPDFSFMADEIEEGYTFEKMKQFIEGGK